MVAAGAVVGGTVRLAITWAWPESGYPWAVTLINLVGSVALGWFAGAHGTGSRWWPFVGPGLLGGFTTFSALAVTPFTSELEPALSVGLLAVTIVGCALAAGAGRAIGRRRVSP